MLAPHHAEESQLRIIRLAPEDVLDTPKLFRRNPMLLNQLRRNGRISRHSGRNRLGFRLKGGDETLENKAAVSAGEGVLRGALRVRHHPGDIALRIADASDAL